MLLDSSEAADADVVFEDVFKMDSLLDAVWRVVILEASPLPVIVPFTGVWFKNDILALRLCSATEDAVVPEVDLMLTVDTFWKWSL